MKNKNPPGKRRFKTLGGTSKKEVNEKVFLLHHLKKANHKAG